MAFAMDGRTGGNGAGPESGRSERLEALGRVSAELLHDLAAGLTALEARAHLASGEARAGRIPAGELERIAGISGELGAMLRDVMDVLRGAPVSPEVQLDPRRVVEDAVVRLVPSVGPVRLRLACAGEGVRVRGPASFLSRAVANLLSNATRHARGEVRVSVAEDAAEVRIEVEDDGPGIASGEAAVLLDLLAEEGGASLGPGFGLGSAAWSVSRLGGSLRYRRGGTLGGACFEIRLPAAAPLCGPPGGT